MRRGFCQGPSVLTLWARSRIPLRCFSFTTSGSALPFPSWASLQLRCEISTASDAESVIAPRYCRNPPHSIRITVAYGSRNMATDAGGTRHYWPLEEGVNLWNENLHFLLGPTTCGGGSPGGAYPSPQETSLHGPTFVYNSCDTTSGDLGIGPNNLTILRVDGV